MFLVCSLGLMSEFLVSLFKAQELRDSFVKCYKEEFSILLDLKVLVNVLR